ncbi:hypothetical protein DASC09_039180 [Saccharomycopsis crataegensis]|uniref:Endonuclease/exonuclease/phosphatase domain-containing protein n=1 Tax=Saccharomycopsis crataegensis TaxID=43959 RepID=A0AAV5QP68_9ASCO|nr:hypothetical protein DASC09_039180 [Saccharomycopsis crataegensis]
MPVGTVSSVLKTIYGISSRIPSLHYPTPQTSSGANDPTMGKSDKSLSLFIRLYTHNIRYDNNNLWEGERPWSERKYAVASSIKFNAAGDTNNLVVALQEVLENQVKDLHELLGADEWSYYGIGREDGITRGEYSPIFWKTSSWELLESSTFWLSETPDRPSKGWDAHLERIVGWVRLKNRKSGIKVNVYSTHFDDQGVVARREATKLIISKMQGTNDDPSFLAGDFNTEPTDEPYKVASHHLLDISKQVTHKADKYGHYGDVTYTGFDGGIRERAKVIDYIWCENPDKQREKGYSLKFSGSGVLHSQYNGEYMSDHRPVVADVIVEKAIKDDGSNNDKDYVILFKPKEDETNKVIAL